MSEPMTDDRQIAIHNAASSTAQRRWRRGLARFVAFVSIVAAINLLCIYGLPAEIDLTGRRTNTLAPQTHHLLGALRSPVEITLLCPAIPKTAAEQNFHRAAAMFRELLETCRRIQPLIRTQELDPQESTEARQMQRQFPDAAPPCVLITSGPAEQPRHEVLYARDLAEFRAGADRRLAAVEFLGEQSLSAVLGRLTSGRKQEVVYVATGHGELELGDSDPESRGGLGVLAGVLRELDFDLRPLELAAVPRVPHDAGLLLLPGGRQPWSHEDAEKVGRYLRQGGKAFILADLELDSAARKPVRNGLEELISEFGVALGDDRVITRGFTGQTEVASPALPAAGAHPLVRSLPPAPLILYECRSLRSSTGLRQLPTISVPLLVSHAAPRAWADGDFGPGQPLLPGGDNDSDGPVVMGMAVERRAEGMTLPALVVVGDAEFISNHSVSQPAGRANCSFVISCLNWLRGRRERLSDVPPRLHESLRLAGSPDDHRGLVWKSSLVLCALIATAGSCVWAARRRG